MHRFRFFFLKTTAYSLNRFHLFCVLLTHGKKRTLLRATALQWGVLWVVDCRKKKKQHTPPEWGA
jgi:hypothetical protein